MIELFVQPVVLQAGEEYLRTAVEWAALGECSQWKAISCVRIKHAWVQIEPYPSLADHPNLASHLIVLTSPDEQQTLALYPTSTLEVNNNLLVSKDGDADLRVVANVRRCISGKEETVHVVGGLLNSGSPRDRKEVIRAVIEEARRCVGGRPKKDNNSQFWDGLGICTWESFGANRIGPIPAEPTKAKLLDLLPSFPVDIFLIDDGWEDHNKDPGGRKSYPPRARLRSFKAGESIRDDMEGTITALKARGVRKVGVWMALQGYWFGIDPEGELAAEYECESHPTIRPNQTRGGVETELKLLEPTTLQWLPHPSKAEKFWIDWFSVLKGWGIDFVKVDNQAHMECIQSPTARHALAAMWSGALQAVHHVWGDMDRIIMCMSHNERMLNGPGGLDFNRPPGNLVFRNSDDYNMPYTNPHGEFVLWNTRNSILTSNLSLIPDYDMFASNPASHRPLYHAFLRAMSVGTVLLSDTPDTDTDLQVLDALTAQSPGGEVKLVRSNVPAVQLPNRWFDLDLSGSSPGKAHLASTWDDKQGCGIVAAWNCHDPSTKAICHDVLSDQDLDAMIDSISSTGPDQYFVVPRRYSKGFRDDGVAASVYSPGVPFNLPFELEEGECEAFAVCKAWSVQDIRVAVLGMQDKLYPFAGLQVGLQSDGSLQVMSHFASARMTLLVDGPRTPKIRVNGVAIETCRAQAGDLSVLSLCLEVGDESRERGQWVITVV